MYAKREFEALVRLLDDPDEEIYQLIQNKLVSFGNEVIPALENIWEHSFDHLLQTRIESIIHTIQFQKVAEDLRIWAQDGGTNLWEGATILARYQYPDLDLSKLNKHFDLIRQDIWLEINDNLTALEKTKVINHILFDVHHFNPALTKLEDPLANYINQVLENKTGTPLSLSLLYACLAQSLAIPVFGVQLPQHFVLGYRDDSSSLSLPVQDEAYKIYFYINPFSQGTIFSRKEIDAFLKQMGVDPQPTYYQTCSNIAFVRCLIQQLKKSYKGNSNKLSELASLDNLLKISL